MKIFIHSSSGERFGPWAFCCLDILCTQSAGQPGMERKGMHIIYFLKKIYGMIMQQNNIFEFFYVKLCNVHKVSQRSLIGVYKGFVSPARFSGGDIQGSLSVVGVTKNFSGTTEASFLIFGTEHQYGELYRVMQF